MTQNRNNEPDTIKCSKLLVASLDKQLYQLCSEIVNDYFGNKWTVVLSDSSTIVPGAALYILDFSRNTDLPIAPDSGHAGRYLFLVDQSELAEFRAKYGNIGDGVMLKPVTRAALAAFLAHYAIPTPDSSGEVDSHRLDRDDILQCAIQANLRLQQYDHERTNFLARAIHDFRGPLTALSGYCGLLLTGELGPVTAEQKEVLLRMQHSGERLSRLASGMFQLSTGQRVEYRSAFEEGDFTSCARQALHELRPFMHDKSLRVSVSMESSPELLYFDSDQIEQVFLNLIENACKFTPRNGSISVQGYPYFWDRHLRSHPPTKREQRSALRENLNSYRIDIRDSGPGIRAEEAARIFEEYAQCSDRGQDRSGAGLGLAICRMIVSRHAGKIWAEPSGTGGVFSFVIPFQMSEMDHEEAHAGDRTCVA